MEKQKALRNCGLAAAHHEIEVSNFWKNLYFFLKKTPEQQDQERSELYSNILKNIRQCQPREIYIKHHGKTVKSEVAR